MRLGFHTVDVFTDRRFGGNPLAVLPEADGLDGERMQAIAREFNYSETTFVLPSADPACTRRVRIFTPVREMPFAGHPNVGTAFVLAATGVIPPADAVSEVVFDEIAGRVPVTVHWRDGRPVSCELRAPRPLDLAEEVDAGALAAAVGLAPADVLVSTHRPRIASVGAGFLFAEIADHRALARARAIPERLADLVPSTAERVPGVHLYTRDAVDPGIDLRARMFAPFGGVAEDPATGSANVALAAMLAHLDPRPDGEWNYAIAQGVEIGRPSLLLARATKAGGVVTEARIGGGCVPVAEGMIEVG